MKSIAIMQPTFLPWIGYFALADRVDEFVLLDNVQFDKRSWQQRNKIKTPQGSIWLSVPVNSKGKSDQLIKDVEILHEGGKNPLRKILNSIQHNYGQAKYYDKYAEDIASLMEASQHNLCQLNQSIIKWCMEAFDIATVITNASDLSVKGSKEDLLVDICKACGAGKYISPPGSKTYLETSNAFERADIELAYHDYNHPEYSQLYGSFEPYMSCLDLMFNEGERSLEIIRSGINNP